MSLLVFTGASQFSAASVVAAGGTTSLGVEHFDAAGGPQRRLRADDGTRAGRPAHPPSGRGAVGASTRRRRWRQLRPPVANRRRRSGSPGSASTCSGTSARSPAPWWGRASTSNGGGSTPPCRRASWRWCGRSIATRNGRLAGLIGALVCLVTIPFVPVGLSILCASVAVLVGLRPERASAVRAVSWTLVIVLGLSAYAFKVLGLVVIGARTLPPRRRALPGLDPGRPVVGIDRQGHVLDRPGARARCRVRRASPWR